MKKHTVVAMVGTLALLANLLVPGLAFGQPQQAGTATLACSTTAPSFTIEPATSFNFYLDGISGDIVSKSVPQHVFNNPNAAALGNTAGTDYIEVNDVRDPSEPFCNNGLSLVLSAVDADSDLLYFDGGTTVGYTIPLDNTYFVTSSDTCKTGATESSAVCYDDTALCGAGDNAVPVDCTTEGVAAFDYTGTAFATIGTYTGVTNSTLGTAANTPVSRSILTFANGDELFGKAGFGISYAATLKAGQPISTYLLSLEYVLTGL